MIKTNIKMRVTPEQSKKVQDICFENGIEWKHKAIATLYTSIPYLYFYEGEDRIYGTKIKESFTNLNLEEIDPELFIRTNGSCIENQNEHLDRLDDIVDEAIKEVSKEVIEDKEMDASRNNGGKTDYYQLENAPFKINDFDDFAEWRNLNGNQFNMGKAMWTFNVGRHNGTDYIRDLNKIIHYANRELLRISRELKGKE